MYNYQELVLDDRNITNKKLLARASRRMSTRNPGAFLEEGILTKLVTFARTRKHNQNPERPTSICSVCSKSLDSSRKCKRWNVREQNAIPQGAEIDCLQPYCEVLGSFICSDCSFERTKRNHLLHLPAIFGLEDWRKDSSSSSYRIATDISRNSHDRGHDKRNFKSRSNDGIIARANTPLEGGNRESYYSVARPLRVQMEHLASLPNVLGERKHRLRQWWYNEMKLKQKTEDAKYDLKSTLSASLSSSMAKYLADVSPRKLIKLKKLKVPCNTPMESADIPKKKCAKKLDVLELAQKLQNLYRERNFSSRNFASDSGSVSGHGSLGSPSLFDDGTLERLFLETGESITLQNDEFSFRTLTFSPTEIDVQDSKRIQENLIDCFGRVNSLLKS